MAQVGVLAVSVIAETKRFAQGLKDAGKDAKTFAANSSKEFSKLGGAFSMLGTKATIAAAAVAGFLALVQTSQELTAMADFADRVGMNVEALQELEFAAERSGVSVNALRMGLQRSTRRIAQAAQGSGEAAGALKELGLNAQALNRLRPEQQFRKIADAMQRVRNQADRVRLAQKLFDSEGVALLQTLKGGTAELDKQAEAFRELGGAVDADTVQQYRKFNEQLTTLNQTWKRFKAELGTLVLPELTQWLNELTEGMKMLRQVANFSPGGQGGASGGGDNDLKKFISTTNKMVRVFVNPRELGRSLRADWKWMRRGFQDTGILSRELGSAFEDLAEETEKTTEMQRRAGGFGFFERGSQEDLQALFNTSQSLEVRALKETEKQTDVLRQLLDAINLLPHGMKENIIVQRVGVTS